MATILHHAALGFAMGAGSFVLAALPSHGSDARTGEPAAPPATTSVSGAKPVASAPPIDVTAPMRESSGLRRLRTRHADAEDEMLDADPSEPSDTARTPRPRAMRRDPEPMDERGYEDPDDADAVPSACLTRDRHTRRLRMMATTARAHEPRSFHRGLRMPVEMPVRRDPRVLQYVRHFTETPEGRATFSAWLERSGKYEGIVSRALEERGLPAALMAVVFVESGCFPSAVSPAGAVGLWQLMPATARAYGLSVEGEIDERRSLWQSSRAATEHLADLYDRFGSWDLALAAYNMGYKALLSRIENNGTDDFWELAAIAGGLPSETAHYVPKVLAAALVLANLDELGFGDVDMAEPIEAGALEVPSGVRLSAVARAARTSARLLRELNPELVADVVPQRKEPTMVHVPLHAVARTRAALAGMSGLDERLAWDRRGPSWEDSGSDAGEEPRPRARRIGGRPLVYFRATAGDTAASIARTFGMKEAQVLAQNGLERDAAIEEGTLLKLRVPDRFVP